jgi:hypothetical protein
MKTAVEWLVEELEMNILWNDKARKAVQQANKMFEEQIINAASDHCYPTGELARIDAEDYYNETFKSE